MSDHQASLAEKIFEETGHYQRLGKIASAWAAFELNVDRVIWDVASVPQTVGACFTSQLIGPQRRFSALICLVRLFKGSAALVDEIQSFSGRAVGLGEERNRVLHDSWFTNPETKQSARFQVTAKKELNFGLEIESLERLDGLVTKIARLSNDIDTLGKKIMNELGPSLGKPPEWPVGLGSRQ